MNMQNRAFTLIELLVVIAIIGIMAAVGVTAYNGYTGAAKASVAKTIHAQTVKYISAESQKCNLGENTIMNNLSCSGITAKKIVSHIGSTGRVLSDMNPYDTSNFAVKVGTSFIAGQVNLSASGSTIIVKTCNKRGLCSTDQQSSKIFID